MVKCTQVIHTLNRILRPQLTCSKRTNSTIHLCGRWCLLSAFKCIFVTFRAHAIIHGIAIKATAHTTEAWWREVLVASLLGHSPSEVSSDLFRIVVVCYQNLKSWYFLSEMEKDFSWTCFNTQKEHLLQWS